VHPKLLLADDSVTIQRVIELTFADEDVQVTAVGDGQQAIDRLRVDRPDIVLADVGMPERDGYEVSAFIKGDPSLSHIPVLLLTGAFEPIDEARAKAVGCDGVLVKPFEPQMVISRVRDLLAGKRSVSAAPAASQASEPAPEPAASLEDYFDRLDAALASKSAATPPPFVPVEQPMAPPVVPPARLEPAAPKPVASPPFPRRVADPAPAPSSSIAAAGPVNLEQAFAALFAAEQGQPVPAAASAPVPTTAGAVSDALVDAVVAKVIARMGDESMRTAVLDAAERLVREEIDRIKSAR
jgi:CheY-like chemotaxis protein